MKSFGINLHVGAVCKSILEIMQVLRLRSGTFLTQRRKTNVNQIVPVDVINFVAVELVDGLVVTVYPLMMVTQILQQL